MKEKKSKAAILVRQQAPLVVDEISLPYTLDYGQVLVAIAYSGICGSQIGEIAGVKGPDRFLPHLLGHEGSGKVLAIGPGVTTVKEGDNVVLHWRPGKGIQAPTPTYQWRGNPLNAGWVTTFNTHAIISENRLTAIPKSIDLEQAALLGCAVTTGFGVVNNDAGIRIGESVVVIGAGGIGLSIIQGAALASAYPIIAVDRISEKLPLAKKLGASHSTTELKEVPSWLEKEGADVVIENTGHPRCIERAYELTKPQGRTILVGVPPKGDSPSFYSLPLHFGKVLKGSHGGDSEPHLDIPRYVRLIEEGKLNLSELITASYPLHSINQAISDLKSGKIKGRCLIPMVEGL